MPGSSPPPATSDFEDEDIYGLADGDLEDAEEEEGEDLFDDDMLKCAALVTGRRLVYEQS